MKQKKKHVFSIYVDTLGWLVFILCFLNILFSWFSHCLCFFSIILNCSKSTLDVLHLSFLILLYHWHFCIPHLNICVHFLRLGNSLANPTNLSKVFWPICASKFIPYKSPSPKWSSLPIILTLYILLVTPPPQKFSH